jgi:DNA invertase Pin-like site-specific DNA recombinase
MLKIVASREREDPPPERAESRADSGMMCHPLDRLGRSLTDLLGILQCLQDKGVDLFLHQQGLDTSTTAGKAMFQMLGVFAEFAGLARARQNGTKLGRRRVMQKRLNTRKRTSRASKIGALWPGGQPRCVKMAES